MLALLSPSKTTESDSKLSFKSTHPRFKVEMQELQLLLQSKSKDEIQKLMKISNGLLEQTYTWIEALSKNTLKNDKRSAIYNYKGGVYVGLDAFSWNEEQLSYAQDHLRILSGLYGILRPFDEIQPYRLEMKTILKTTKGTNLYHFWRHVITSGILADMKKTGNKYIVNLASDEYFKAIDVEALKMYKIIHVDFFEIRKGQRTFVTYSAKKARGLMAKYIIKNKLVEPDMLKSFDYDGFQFNYQDSTDCHLIFEKHISSS